MKKNQTNKNCLKKYLYIVATPIGNLDDISERAIRTLKEVDFIICENPKHSLKLLNNKGIKKKLIPLHDYNEKKIINKIAKNKNNSKIAFISDAGSPLISDPGYRLIKYFIENNYFITAIPGASSVINALQLSGLPIHNFSFFGFVPKQKTKTMTNCSHMIGGFISLSLTVSPTEKRNTDSDNISLKTTRLIPTRS